MEPLKIDGKSLSIHDVIAVARLRRRVELSEESRLLTDRCRLVVDLLVKHNSPVYGLTTGFGSKRNIFINREDTKTLQHNLIRSHASGIGKPLPEDVVRAALLLRANALARGHSGLRTLVLEKILELLNRDIYPWVPDQGSVSASGDLAPLSHLSLVVIGDAGGMVYDPRKAKNSRRRGEYVATPDPAGFLSSSKENLKNLFGYTSIELEAKEGLALTNGVQVTCAMGLINAYDALSLVKHADVSCALSVEAMKGIGTAFAAEIAEARPYPGQIASARNIRAMLSGSSIISMPINLAILRKAVNILRGSGPLVSDEAIGALLQETIEIIESVRLDPHGVVARHKERVSATTSVQDGILTASDPTTLSLRKGLMPAQMKLQKAIHMVLDPERDSHKKAGLRENLTEVANLLERAVPKVPSVQDDYSFRCASQVHGAVRNTLAHVIELLEIEANSSTDNPLIFPPEGPQELGEYEASLTIEQCREAVKSGGNFHGEPLALPMDYLTAAVSELGSIAERRVAKVVDGKHNNGLPSLLVDQSGLNSGFMIPQYTAAALVSENKSLCFPASVDSIPTCENTEDHVSMGLIAARKTRTVIENAEKIIAIELLNAFQGIHFRAPFHQELGEGSQSVFNYLRDTDGIQFVTEDRILAPLIQKTLDLVTTGSIVSLLESGPGLQ